MEIIALKQYTDKIVSLYEGEIRNIADPVAQKLIEQGVVAEHTDGNSSGGKAYEGELVSETFFFQKDNEVTNFDNGVSSTLFVNDDDYAKILKSDFRPITITTITNQSYTLIACVYITSINSFNETEIYPVSSGSEPPNSYSYKGEPFTVDKTIFGIDFIFNQPYFILPKSILDNSEWVEGSGGSGISQ